MASTEKQKKECPCTSRNCPRHGDCDTCKEYHHSRGSKTACERLKG